MSILSFLISSQHVPTTFRLIWSLMSTVVAKLTQIHACGLSYDAFPVYSCHNRYSWHNITVVWLIWTRCESITHNASRHLQRVLKGFPWRWNFLTIPCGRAHSRVRIQYGWVARRRLWVLLKNCYCKLIIYIRDVMCQNVIISHYTIIMYFAISIHNTVIFR